MKELGLWQKLRHPNIVQFLGVLKHSERLIFLTEYLCNVSFVITEFIFLESCWFFLHVNVLGKFAWYIEKERKTRSTHCSCLCFRHCKVQILANYNSALEVIDRIFALAENLLIRYCCTFTVHQKYLCTYCWSLHKFSSLKVPESWIIQHENNAIEFKCKCSCFEYCVQCNNLLLASLCVSQNLKEVFKRRTIIWFVKNCIENIIGWNLHLVFGFSCFWVMRIIDFVSVYKSSLIRTFV